MYRSGLKTTNKTSGKCALIPQVTHTAVAGDDSHRVKKQHVPFKTLFLYTFTVFDCNRVEETPSRRSPMAAGPVM